MIFFLLIPNFLLTFRQIFYMKRIVSLMLVIGLSINSLSAQKNLDPTPGDIELAKKLRTQYPKDDVAILSGTENISFGYNKKAKKVTVTNTQSAQMMNINHRADIGLAEFYDSESKIEKFSLKYRNDRTANFAVRDEFYRSEDMFYTDARVKYMNVDFPVQGYSYNYEMEKKYDDVKYFTSIYFNDQFPIIKKQIVIAIPDWLSVELKEFNFAGNSIKKTEKKLEGGITEYTYTAENIPAHFKEDNTPGRSYLYPHILIIAKSVTNEGEKMTLFNSSADLYKWYKSLVDLMKDDPTVFADKVKELTTSAKTDEEKVKNIYYWVQDNIRYVAFEDGIAGFKPDESNNVYQKRYGDCKGMANLIKQMLKLAGFDARLTWIGTKHIAYDYTIPSLAVDNHMICTLLLNGKKYYLDGTEKYNSFGTYAERIQGKEVMIENGDAFLIEKIPLAGIEENKETYKASLKVEGEKLVGSSSRNYSGESRTQFLNIFHSFKADKKKEALENYLALQNKNIHIENLKDSGLQDRDKKLNLDYSISLDNRVSTYDNELYIDLEFVKEFRNYDFKERKADYEFDYKNNYESLITLEIPAGYKVSKLPDNLAVNEPYFTASVDFAQTGSQITLKKSFIVKNATVKAGELTKWNEFIKKLNGIYNQQIILTKQ